MAEAPRGLQALRRALADEEGPLAESLTPSSPGHTSPGEQSSDGASPPPPQLAAAGPRTRGQAEAYELLLEMIYEGSELHYGTPRVLAPADSDLALLLGDQLFALGLLRLSELGDLEAVAELADVISLVAQAGAHGDRALIEAAWEQGARAIGWGATAEHAAAKARARAGGGLGS